MTFSRDRRLNLIEVMVKRRFSSSKVLWIRGGQKCSMNYKSVYIYMGNGRRNKKMPDSIQGRYSGRLVMNNVNRVGCGKIIWSAGVG